MHRYLYVSSLVILGMVFTRLHAQNFENGFDFNLLYNDTAAVEFLPSFNMAPITESDRVSTDGSGNFIVKGKPYRFFGGNLTTRGAFPEKENSTFIAGRMKKFGLNLVRSLQILQRCCRMLGDKCIAGITADRDVCACHFEVSAGLATVLNPRLGYDKVAGLVKESLQTRKTLKELVLEKGIMPAEELEALLKKSTGPTL